MSGKVALALASLGFAAASCSSAERTNLESVYECDGGSSTLTFELDDGVIRWWSSIDGAARILDTDGSMVDYANARAEVFELCGDAVSGSELQLSQLLVAAAQGEDVIRR